MDTIPMLLNSNISSNSCTNNATLNVINSSLKKSSKFSSITNTQKFELESILATASDPSKSVGSVLVEAGIGSEFHAIGRLKSISNRTQNSQISFSQKLLTPTFSSNKIAKNHIIVKDHSSTVQTTNDIVTSSSNHSDNVEIKSNSFIVRTQNNPKKLCNLTLQIPCSYKGCQKVF